ncbi:hypothetical protein ACFXOM_27155 [Streptomyces sp. NPDC059169]
MSPIWDEQAERASGTCAACGLRTDDGIVTWLPRMSAAHLRLIVHAHPDACQPPQNPSPLPLRRL